jgi:hypothetical protein
MTLDTIMLNAIYNDRQLCSASFFVIMLSVVILNVIMLSFVILNVIMLSVVAPFCHLGISTFKMIVSSS